MPLPTFDEHDGHAKLEPLSGPEEPRALIAQWLSRVVVPDQRSSVRVLDLGCGRGGMVAWLVDQGFDAYGLDIRREYIDNGRAFLGADRLAVLDVPEYPYPDDFFDIVISDQVFEHVRDLKQLAGQVARTTKFGGIGMHLFPGKWTIVEPHLLAPFVHWLPKGRLRRSAIELAIRAGRTAPYFPEYSVEDRTAIFADYSDQNTYYRRPAVIRRALESAGLTVDFRGVLEEEIRAKLGNVRLPNGFVRAGVWAYRNTRTMCITTAKPST